MQNKTSDLIEICNLKNTGNTETGWGKFFTETNMFNIKSMTVNKKELLDQTIRLTLDYSEDLMLFQQILNNLKWPFDLIDIIKLLNNRPDIKNLNNSVKEVYWKNFENNSTKVTFKKNEY